MSDYLNATLRAVTRMLSLPLRQCRRCPCFARPVPGLLQSHATTFEPRCPNAGSCLLRQPAAARGSLNFAAVVGASLRLGCALPARRRDSSHATTSTGRGSTYLGRNAVSTKPATSALSAMSAGGTSLSKFAAEVTAASHNPAVNAIVVHVDSGGGSVIGMEAAHRVLLDAGTRVH